MRDVSLQRAIDLAREHAARTEPEHVPVGSAAGRRLAAAVTARADLPSEDASAMDGCAVRAADSPGALALAGESAAGAPLAAPPTVRGAPRVRRAEPRGPRRPAALRHGPRRPLHAITSLSGADALAWIPAQEGGLREGETVAYGPLGV